MRAFLNSGPGPRPIFDPSCDYRWLILHSQNDPPIDLSQLSLDTSAFFNSHSAGSFALSSVGGDVYINFTSVPESYSAAWLAGFAALIFRRRNVRF
jgi:hypothetical protein